MRKVKMLGATSTVLLVTALAFTSAPVANATSSNSQKEVAVADEFATSLEEAATSTGNYLEISDVKIDLSEQILAETGGDVNQIVAELTQGVELENPVVPPSASKRSDASRPPVTPFAARTFTVDQFSGVPAGGVSWVKQDIRADVSNSRIRSAYPIGSSWQEGVAAFQWTHNRSWTEIKRGGFCVSTRMKGVFSAIVKGSPVSFSATFLATRKAVGSNLEPLNYMDCR